MSGSETSRAADLTLLLDRAAAGDAGANEAFYREVYGELRRQARAFLLREADAHLLQPTALVNEAFLKLWQDGARWENRRHFFAAAARGMRQVLVDEARRRDARKRGGDYERVSLGGLGEEEPSSAVDILRLDRLLDELEKLGPRFGRLVELRCFVGLGIEEAATVLEVSPATVKRDWAFVRAWLLDRLEAA